MKTPQLKEGEVRRIHPGGHYKKLVNTRVEVYAYHVNPDTAYVELVVINNLHGDKATVAMEDTVAEELTKMIRRALYMLPSSK